jgi:uncharacterized protein (DUF305 family)
MLALVFGSAAAAVARSTDRKPDSADGFRAMMNKAVAHMHETMNVPFSGDADRDFARMMIPHHQGAIDMALVELRYGKDERLKRLAQEIIVAQQQEIAVMHLALGDTLPPGNPSPTQLSPKPQVDHDH